jgi:hypothetical protein
MLASRVMLRIEKLNMVNLDVSASRIESSRLCVEWRDEDLVDRIIAWCLDSRHMIPILWTQKH